MKTIAIGGGTGLVGKRLIEKYKGQYNFHVLTRSDRKDEGNVKYFKWDLNEMTMDAKALDCDYLINLTGAGIADKRWTTDRKKVLIESRVKSNELLYQTLLDRGSKLPGIACASAVGYYGDRGSEVLTEASSLGEGFLAECCDLWEKSSNLLISQTDSLSIIRISVVLSTKDGALPKILMTKSLGVMSYFGAGEMYYSWIHIDDLADLFIHMLEHGKGGVINAASPETLPNKAFTKKVKKGVDSGAILLPAPAFGLRLAMGEMADVVLNSTRVTSTRMDEVGFKFSHPELSEAVADLKARSL